MTTRSHSHRMRLRKLSALIAATLLVLAICIPMMWMQQSLADDAGSIELQIVSIAPDISDDNVLYSLEGARFGIFSDAACTQRTGELVTDENGFASATGLAPGHHFIRQELASAGFAVSTQLLQEDVIAAKTTSASLSVTPCYSVPQTLVQELNIETGFRSGVGSALLGGALYVVSYYDSYDPGDIFTGPTRSWKFRSDDQGNVMLSEKDFVEGSPLYKGPRGQLAMPLGKYRVTVEKEPIGFICASPALVGDIVSDSRESIDPICMFPKFEMSYQVIRGDFMFRKADAQGTPLAGIPFLLSMIDERDNQPVESHVLVTDEHGDFCSHNDYLSHVESPNKNDEAIMASIEGVYQLDEERLSARHGLWFSKDSAGAIASPNANKGALPYGSYVLQELPCAKNASMNLNTVQFSIHRDDFVVKLDAIVNTAPAIFECATDAADGDKLIRPSKDAMAKIKISYQNLVPGTRYVVKCSASSAATGKAVCNDQGVPSFSSANLVPEQAQGTLVIELPLDTSSLAGERIEIDVELEGSGGMRIAQSVLQPFDNEIKVEPIINASVYDARDEDKYCMGPDALIQKSIAYQGLSTERRYTLLSTLQDKATGNAMRDSMGNVIAASVEFVPEAAQGAVAMNIPFDASVIAGHDVVVFDKIIDDEGIVIANHQDMDDFDQTIKTVKLSSYATDKADGDKQFDGNAMSVTICDTINYANLVPGMQYELKGVLMDKDTGNALAISEAPVSASASFVAQETSGTVDVEFSFDATQQSSQVLVAFESLEHEDNVIAEHRDLDDVAQTVTSQEIDPDSLSSTGDAGSLSGKAGNGKPVLTGDQASRLLVFSLLILIGIALCIAYILRLRRRTLESIARVESIARARDSRN